MVVSNDEGFERDQLELDDNDSEYTSHQIDGPVTNFATRREIFECIKTSSCQRYNSPNYVSVFINGTQEVAIVERGYKTLIETLSEIGGIAGLFIILFEYINSLYNAKAITLFIVKNVLGDAILSS